MRFWKLFVLLLSILAGPPMNAQDIPCDLFPPDNVWNTRIDHLPVHARSDAYIESISAGTGLHPDFGTVYMGAPIGIPFVVAPMEQALVDVDFLYADESDSGPYPIPPDAPIEGGPDSGGDRHILVVVEGDCLLFELFDAHPNGDGSWSAGSGAVYDLMGNGLRPATWTSADAAGLPIVPGLVRYEEVAAGEIRHALRFTARRTQRAYVWPARHFASSIEDPDVPPMGQRFRLKASFETDGFSPEVQVIIEAMKRYGIILADNGSDWYISGAPNPLWDDDVLRELRMVTGADFEAVDVSSLIVDADSAEARQAGEGSEEGVGEGEGESEGEGDMEGAAEGNGDAGAGCSAYAGDRAAGGWGDAMAVAGWVVTLAIVTRRARSRGANTVGYVR